MEQYKERTLIEMIRQQQILYYTINRESRRISIASADFQMTYFDNEFETALQHLLSVFTPIEIPDTSNYIYYVSPKAMCFVGYTQSLKHPCLAFHGAYSINRLLITQEQYDRLIREDYYKTSPYLVQD